MQCACECIVQWQVRRCSPFKVGKSQYFAESHEDTAADVTSKMTGLSTSVLSAEVMFAQFVAEHNLPFSVADHFTKLAKQLFPDSDIAGKFTSNRMKTTMIVKKALAPRLDANVVQLCQSHQFLLLTDESNDQGGKKTLTILVKVFDSEIARAVT